MFLDCILLTSQKMFKSHAGKNFFRLHFVNITKKITQFYQMCWASALRSWPSAGIWVIQRESSRCNLSTRITGGGKPFNGLIIQNLLYRVHAYSVAILAPAISSWHWFMMSLVLGSAWILSLVRTWWLLFAQPAPTPPCWCCWHQQGILSSVSAAISACSECWLPKGNESQGLLCRHHKEVVRV